LTDERMHGKPSDKTQYLKRNKSYGGAKGTKGEKEGTRGGKRKEPKIGRRQNHNFCPRRIV